jgi:GAF domain-containing protein
VPGRSRTGPDRPPCTNSGVRESDGHGPVAPPGARKLPTVTDRPGRHGEGRQPPSAGGADDQRASFDLPVRSGHAQGSIDTETLIAIERAAASVVEPVSRLWHDVARSVDASVSPQTLDAVLRDSLETMARLLSVNAVAVLIANETGDELVARAAIWLSEEVTLGLGIRAGQGMAGRVLASRSPLVLGDLSTHPVVNPALRHSGLRSVVAVPLLSGDQPLGVLYAASYDLDRFAAEDAALLQVAGDRLAAALDRVRLFEREREARRTAAFFARAAQVLAEATDLRETLDRLALLAVGALGEICLIDVVGEDGQITRMVAKHRDPAMQPAVERLRTEFSPDPSGRHPGIRAILEGGSSWSTSMDDEFLRSTTVSDDHFELVKALGFRSYLTVPLAAARRVVGSVTCVSTSRPFAPEDISFAEQLASHVASVVDNARRYESAFRTSQILQSSLLPADLPTVPGLDVDVRYLTANRGIEVGGDFYDLVLLPSGAALFMIGDVAGHDRAAAAEMGRLRSAARALAGRADAPASLLAALRASWPLLGMDRMATALFGLLDPATGAVSAVSAGHYPPLVVSRRTASFAPVHAGAPLGVTATPDTASAPTGREWRATLLPGEVLLCYTDGAIDERVAGPAASMERLAAVAGGGALSAAEVCDRVVGLLDPTRSDDVALLALSLRRPVDEGQPG